MSASDNRGRFLAEFENCVHLHGSATVPGAGGEHIIWDGFGLPSADPHPAAAGPTEVVSDNAADAIAGTGAQTLDVVGLTSDFTLESEEGIELAGTTPVAMAIQFLRVLRARVRGVGSAEWNVGTITIRPVGGGAMGAILPTFSITRTSTFTVPKDRVLAVETYSMSTDVGGDLNGGIRVRDRDGVVLAPIPLAGTGGASDRFPYPDSKPYVVREGVDLWMGADVSGGGEITTRMIGELEDARPDGEPAPAGQRAFFD